MTINNYNQTSNYNYTECSFFHTFLLSHFFWRIKPVKLYSSSEEYVQVEIDNNKITNH